MKKGLVLSIGSFAIAATLIGSNVAFASSDSNQGLPLKIKDLESALNSFEATVTTEITNLQTSLNGLKDTTTSQSQQINDLNTTASKQTKEISTLESTVSSLQTQVSSLQTSVQELTPQQFKKFTNQDGNWYVTPDTTKGYDAKIYFTTNSSYISHFAFSPILFQDGNLVTPGAVTSETWGLTGGLINGVLNVTGNTKPFLESKSVSLPVNKPLILNLHADSSGASISITDDNGNPLLSIHAPISDLNYNGYSPSGNYQWGILVPNEVSVSKALINNYTYTISQ